MLAEFNDVWVSYPHYLDKHKKLTFYTPNNWANGVSVDFHLSRPMRPILVCNFVVSIDESGCCAVWNKQGQLLNSFTTPHVGFILRPLDDCNFVIVDFNRRLGLANIDGYIGDLDKKRMEYPNEYLSLWDYLVLKDE